jgi:asparagine synthase (glutamine-hydrolysing)
LLTAEMQYDAPFSRLDEPQIIAPFCSQPLVETCLRSATYLSVHEGCDRAVARRAFSKDLPAEILRRSTKGSPGLWMRGVILRNHSFIRELFLDGIMVSEGLLDRKKVEIVLGSAPAKSLSNEVDIVSKLYTEAWLRKWLQNKRLAVRQ